MVGRFKSEESMSTQPSMPTSIPIKEARTLDQEGKGASEQVRDPPFVKPAWFWPSV